MTSAPNLAFAYQEILTVVARLRSKKVALGDSAVFRTQVRKALQVAENTAQGFGCSQEDIRLASFATIALMDETILNSSNPAFRDWAQKPMMLDLYGTLNAGESFFEQMRAIAKRGDTKSTIDLLEVYVLCLALGFRGRYSAGSEEQLRALRDPLVARILRQRETGDCLELSRSWRPDTEVEMPAPPNRLTRLAFSGCVAVFSVCVLLWISYHFLLDRGAEAVAGILPR